MSAPLPNQYCLPPEGSDEDDQYQYDDVVQNLYLIMMMLPFQHDADADDDEYEESWLI